MPVHPASAPARILVIEDDAADFLLLTRQLDTQSLAADFRRIDRDSELDDALTEHWDVVLADYHVPGMDARTSLARIRAQRPDLPVILVTGKLDEEALVDLFHAGFADFVFKDRLIRLVPAIRRVLKLAEAQRAEMAAIARQTSLLHKLQGMKVELEAQNESLRETEFRLANVLLATREAVWDCDLKTGRVSHNRRWCELLGFDDTMLEHPVQVYYDLIHPADRAAVQQRIDAALATCDEYSAEYRLRRNDGHYVWVADHGLVIDRASDGTPLRILGAFADIGRRKAAQEQLETAKQQFHALTARLQAVREEERSRIAGEVHDEFGQLITALSLDLAGLGKRIRKVGDAALRGEMEQRMDDIDALIQQMLGSVVEIASELRPQVLDNLGLPATIRFEAGRFEARTGIACELAVPDELPDLPANCATALFRIFQEALTNVTRHARATQVAISLARTASGSVVLSISDNGRGIMADELTASGAHDALGLLGMRERAAQLGGSVEIAGRPGQGTTVTVMLP